MPSAVGVPLVWVSACRAVTYLIERYERSPHQLSAEEMPDDLFNHTSLSDEGGRGPAGGMAVRSSLIRRGRYSRTVDVGQVPCLCHAERPR